MTELSPVGTMGEIKGSLGHLDHEALIRLKLKQGRPHFLTGGFGRAGSGQADRQAGRPAGRAGRQSRPAGVHAGRQAGGQAGGQACPCRWAGGRASRQAGTRVAREGRLG